MITKIKYRQIVNNEWFAFTCLIVIFLIRQISTIDIDLIIGDEGIIVMVYKRFYQGYRLYQEVWNHYGPLAPYFYSLVFNIFGMSMMVVRYTSTILLTAGLAVSFLICRRFMPPWWSAVAALVSFLMLYQPIYSYGNVFPMLGGLFGIYFLLKFNEQGLYRWIFWSGFSIGMALLQKPIPLGGMMWFSLIISSIVYWRWQKKNVTWNIKKVIAYYCAGSSIITIPVYAAIIYSNSLANLKINFLFFLTYFGTKSHAGGWPNIFTYALGIFESRSILSLYNALKDTYYSLCFYLPLIMGIVTLFYVFRNRDRSHSFILMTLALFSPLTFFQFYYTGNRIGHGEMGMLIPPAIILMIFFIRMAYDSAAIKKSRIIMRGVIIAGLLCFYALPSMYIFRPEIRERILTVPGLKGIKVSQQIYDTLEKTTDFMLNNVPETEAIVTAGYDTDIFNVILDNPNAFGSNYIYWRELYNSGVNADPFFYKQLLPTLKEKMPRAIIFGIRKVPGEAVNTYLEENYDLTFQTGDILNDGEPYKDYHLYGGYRVYLRKM